MFYSVNIMSKLSENTGLQKDIWFVFSTIIFFIIAFALRYKNFMPYGILFCVGYVLLINIGFILINKMKKSIKTIEEEVPLPDN